MNTPENTAQNTPIQPLQAPLESNRTATNTRTIVWSTLLGLALLFGAGFAKTSVLHNAAHDTRHAAGFPCH